MKGKKTGGRRKGSVNKVTIEKAAEIAESGLTPLDYMLSVVRNQDADPNRRDKMASAAAPYCHPHLSSIEHTGKDRGPIEVTESYQANLRAVIGYLMDLGLIAREEIKK